MFKFFPANIVISGWQEYEGKKLAQSIVVVGAPKNTVLDTYLQKHILN